MDMISIILENFSSFQHSYEIFDVVCNSSLPPLELEAWETVETEVCSNGATNDGHGHIQYRVDDSQSWIEKALISEGETIRMTN